jgi:hypothetical protein
MKPTSNTTRNHGLVLTSMREQAAAENERLLWKAYYRNALRTATCTSCTGTCKGDRKGCGNFTPKAAFTTSTRQRFVEGRTACV